MEIKSRENAKCVQMKNSCSEIIQPNCELQPLQMTSFIDVYNSKGNLN